MSIILCIYHYLNIAFGIVNIHYNPTTNTYNLYHWPTMLYGVTFIAANLIFQHFVTYIYWNVALYCELIRPLIIINLFLLFSNYALFMTILLNSWLKRQRVYGILYKFKYLLKYYLSDKSINENHKLVMHTRNLFLRKCFLSVCEIIVLYLHLFERIRGPKCEYVNHNHYMASSVYIGIIDLTSVLMDINIYMGLVLIYMCVQMLMQRLRKIEKDVKLMHRLQRSSGVKPLKLNIHRKWRQLLRQHILIISRDERKLKNLVEELFGVVQLQLLLLLMCFFFSLVSLLFFILIYISNIENIKVFELLFVLFVLVTNISNVVLFYNVCELLVNSFKEMGLLVYEICIYASLGTRDLFRQDALVLDLELFLLQLQCSKFKFRVCGLFEIRHSTCIALLSSVFLNLLYLIQSVISLI